MILTTDELSEMRSEVEDSFDLEATVLRQVFLSDGAGGNLSPFVATGAALPCRMRPKRRYDERVQAGEVQSLATHSFLFAAEADVLPTDRLEIGNVLFEVIATNAGRSEAKSLEILCQQVK